MWSAGKTCPGGFIFPRVTIWSILPKFVGETVKTGFESQARISISGPGEGVAVGASVELGLCVGVAIGVLVGLGLTEGIGRG